MKTLEERLEQLIQEWDELARALDITNTPPGSFDHIANLATKSAFFDAIDDLRAAMKG